MKRILPLIVSIGMILSATYIYGNKTDRWGMHDDLVNASQRLTQIPMTIGEWEGNDLPLTEADTYGDVAAVLKRNYTHRFTNEQVTLLIQCGRPGAVSVHPPEVCYVNAGFVLKNRQVQELADHGTAWTALFEKPSSPIDNLHLTWAWGNGTVWSASESPRTEYADKNGLYKIYIVQPPRDSADKTAQTFVNAVSSALSPISPTVNE